MRFRRALLVVALVLGIGSLFAGGCWLEMVPWHHEEGYAVMRWTIDGRVDPSACVELGAQRVEIRTIDAAGDLRSISTPRCDAFEDTLLLEDGYYDATLELVDATGQPVSSRLTARSFHVVFRESVVVVVDFATQPSVR